MAHPPQPRFAIRVFVAARAPESDERLELVVLRFEFVVERLEFVVLRLFVSVETESEREMRLVFVFPSDFESILMFVSSVVRRENTVSKILEKAPCKLERSGAESNCIVQSFLSMILMYCFQSSVQVVLVF